MSPKDRVAKDNEHEAIERELDELLSPISSSLKDLFKIEKLGDKDIYSTNFVYIDGEGEPYVHENFGKGGNEQRADDRCDRAERLKNKYPDLWGKRSGAKRITLSEQMQREKEIAEGKNVLGENLDVRTIQKYFKDFP